MAAKLLIKLAFTGMVGASALFGARESKAMPAEWSSYRDIVPTTAPAGYGNPSEGQPINSINYSSSSSIPVVNNFSAVYFIVDGGFSTPVGGFDVRNGQVTSSSFNGFSTWYGLTSGDTANSAEGSNPQNSFEGYWAVFYDSKKADGSAGSDGVLGTYETDEYGSFQYFINGAEQLDSSQFSISDFTPYGSVNPGTFTFTASIPQSPVGALTALGLNTVALPYGANVVHFRVAVTNLASFRVEYRDSLTNAAWMHLGSFNATGAVTVATDTNAVPARFYRAVSP